MGVVMACYLENQESHKFAETMNALPLTVESSTNAIQLQSQSIQSHSSLPGVELADTETSAIELPVYGLINISLLKKNNNHWQTLVRDDTISWSMAPHTVSPDHNSEIKSTNPSLKRKYDEIDDEIYRIDLEAETRFANFARNVIRRFLCVMSFNSGVPDPIPNETDPILPGNESELQGAFEPKLGSHESVLLQSDSPGEPLLSKSRSSEPILSRIGLPEPSFVPAAPILAKTESNMRETSLPQYGSHEPALYNNESSEPLFLQGCPPGFAPSRNGWSEPILLNCEPDSVSCRNDLPRPTSSECISSQPILFKMDLTLDSDSCDNDAFDLVIISSDEETSED